ncbi:MAG TPA: ECF transporter S component [Candidatus Eisenbacteria bacterium]|uniref:ECF transporter S component n=1 Tax=Eiseniibacteriota bacterium TaxID=2212470 RepID=A0A7V2AUT7_UNCEI|nr:ECF transporter S component [Candidatus Eisenbacteria bacterium]
MENHTRRIIQTGLFAALVVVLGFLFAEVPNVELMTLSVFLSGVILGRRNGVIVGTISIVFYSLFNPYGPPLPPLFAAQILGFALVGWTGGMLRRLLMERGRASYLFSALAGLLLTLIYDSLTTIATAAVALGTDGLAGNIAGFFLAGALFIAVHSLSNTIVFAVAAVPVLRAVAAWEGGRSA